MKVLTYKEKLKMTRTLSTLLDELDEECLKTIKLIKSLQFGNLNDEHFEEMLGELSAMVTHLKIHSEQVDKAIAEELEMER